MKSTTMKLMVTAAALAIATGVASAQTLRADVPFAFRAGSKIMNPGTYDVRTNHNGNYLVISNAATNESVVLLAGVPVTPSKAWTAAATPVMSFDCGASRCELSRLWTASDSWAMKFATHAGREEQASVQEIRLVKVLGD